MKLMLLVCSGKAKISNSRYFAEKLIECYEESHILNIKSEIFYVFNMDNAEIIKEIKNFDTIVLVSPIYAGTVPSRVLDFMKAFEQSHIDDRSRDVYIMDQCGFYGFRSESDIITYKLWAGKSGLKWKGSFRISAGELMLNVKHKAKDKGPHKDMFYKMDLFAKSIAEKKNFQMTSYPVRFPRMVFILLGNGFWGLSRKKGSFTAKYTIDESNRGIF